MVVGEVEAAFAASAAVLPEPGFAHLLGISVGVGDEVLAAGRALDQPTDIFSVTKTVLAVAVSEAVRANLIGDLDEFVVVAREAAGRPTVRSLMGMTQSWRVEPDMDVLERQPHDVLPEIVASLDGGAAATGRYVNAGMHLLMRELDQRTGSARDFIDERVLAPAGVHEYRWEVDSTGVPWGHAHLHLSVRDLLRVGRHWLREGLRPRVAQATAPMPPEFLPYAEGVWIGAGLLLAAGWGGQCMMLVPSADAVLVALGATGWDRATNTDLLSPHWRSGRELFERELLPALLDEACDLRL